MTWVLKGWRKKETTTTTQLRPLWGSTTVWSWQKMKAVEISKSWKKRSSMW